MKALRDELRLGEGEAPRGEDELERISLGRLESEISELAAHIHAATCRWLLLVAEFDRREGWAEWGSRSCAHWLSWRCALSPQAAREQLRVARRLAGLPGIRESFARGELSYSQVRALSRIATPDSEQGLVEFAGNATAAQLELVVRAYRGVLETELGDSDQEHRRRYVRCEHDDDGSLLISARLPAEEGALVVAALEAGRDGLRAGGVQAAGAARSASAETTHSGDSRDEAPGERAAASNADALVLMAETLLSAGPERGGAAERYQVVVHVDAATLAEEGEGCCQLEGGSVLKPEVARRLACDASVVRILERDGRPLSLGRKTRSTPPALRRALQSRDRSCRFPGCSQRRFLHAHHIEHWAQGGRTELSNLIQLCARHHRLVHEGGYRVERRARGALRFRRPDGRAIPALAPRVHGDGGELLRRNPPIDPEACVPRWYGDRLRLPLVVDGLLERDPRLRE